MGTFIYQASEQAIEGCWHGRAADSHCFGMLLLVLRTGQLNPFEVVPELCSFSRCHTLESALMAATRRVVRKLLPLNIQYVRVTYGQQLAHNELRSVTACLQPNVCNRPVGSMLWRLPYLANGP